MGGHPGLHAVRLAIARSRAKLRASISHEEARLLEVELSQLVAKREYLMAHIVEPLVDAPSAARGSLRQVDYAAITLAQHYLDATMSFDGADFGDVQLYDEQRGGLVILVHRNLSHEALSQFSLITTADCTPCARSLRNDSVVLVDDVSQDVELGEHRDAIRQAGIEAVQSYPLHRRDGTLFGIISTHFRTPHEFSAERVGEMVKFTASIGEGLERKIFLTG